MIELAELSITEIQPKLKTTKNLLNGKIFSDNLHQKAIPVSYLNYFKIYILSNVWISLYLQILSIHL